MVFLCAYGRKATNGGDTIPGYNPDAVSVNSIAPDHGLADPHVIIVHDTLYVMCGHDKTWNTVDFCHMNRWELWETTNLKDWKHVLNILPTQTYIGNQDNCWAGDFGSKDGKYYWYFSDLHFSTGVMEAASMRGPWKDALGKPLLPEGLTPTKSYDPEIFKDNGENVIVFGAGQYYIATLDKNMIFLADKPQKLLVLNEDGTTHPTGDKSSLFKRGNWYYLFWGNQYAMGRKLRGPYTYKGSFLDGGHGSAFQWHGQWYSIQENHETNAFYRGVQVRPIYFNEDSTVYIPKRNFEYPMPGRIYNFKYSTQGWRSEKGTKVKRHVSPVYLYGQSDCRGAIIASTPFLNTPIYLDKEVKIVTKCLSGNKILRLALNGYDDPTQFTRVAPKKVDWNKEEWVRAILKESDDWQEIVISLSDFKTRKKYLHQIAIQPIPDEANAEWFIKSVIVE